MSAPHIELDQTQIQKFLQRVQAVLSPAEFALLNTLVETMLFLSTLVRRKSDVIVKLLKLVFAPPPKPQIVSSRKPPGKTPLPGHRAKGTVEMVPKAIRGPSASLSLTHSAHGDRCPECLKGKVYKMAKPGFLIRLLAAPLVQAHAFELEKLRCNLCGWIFAARHHLKLPLKKRF
jgi:transposase